MRLDGKTIGILIESDFYENEVFYYDFRFAEDGAKVRYLSRLWGNSGITFEGHELKAPFHCHESFENLSDVQLADFDAIIVPSGMVSDRLRYTEDVAKVPPACEFLRRAFANPHILKGIICHGLWLCAPITEVIRGRRLVCHNNLHGDALAYGATYVNEDVVVDRDLVTGRTGKHCHLFAKKIIETLAATSPTEKAERLLAMA
jgi:protease I